MGIHLAGSKEQNCNFSRVKADGVIFFMRHKAEGEEDRIGGRSNTIDNLPGKVATNNTVPSGIVLLVKFPLDICGHVFL